jgi:ribosomal-protein-alanine N-acetyltransferase
VTDFELTTSRLVLRDFTPEDEAAFIAYRADLAEARELVERFAAWRRAVPRLNSQVAICRRDAASTLIGCCGLRREGFSAGVAEFGLELAPTWQGRYRYAIEITEAMLGYGFETLDLEEIVSNTTEANERVHRLARWYGATLASWGDGKALWRFRRATWREATHAGRQGRRSARRSTD